MNKKAIGLLCVIPNDIHIDFFQRKNFEDYDIYFICDSMEILKYNSIGNIHFIQIDNSECEKNGYIDANFFINKKISAWDKSIYYFCEIKTIYEHVWLIEEDVFIPTDLTLKNIDTKYTNQDLLCQSCGENINGKTDEWFWLQAKNKIDPPWYNSMVCAIRVSNKLFQCIKKYVEQNKTLIFIEILFTTIAKQNNLNILVIEELSTIIYRRDHSLNKNNIDNNNLYHPVKDIKNQYELRHNSDRILIYIYLLLLILLLLLLLIINVKKAFI